MVRVQRWGSRDTGCSSAGNEDKTVRDLEDDPDRNRKLYDVYWDTFKDVPQDGVVTPMPFDEWVKWALDYPGLSHAAYSVAVCGEDSRVERSSCANVQSGVSFSCHLLESDFVTGELLYVAGGEHL